MSGIADLIDRMEKLEGPDREVDADLDVALFGGETVWKQANYTMESYPASRRLSKYHVGGFANEHVPIYTASLDAAAALVERVLPGWWWKVGTCCVSDDACIAPDFNSPIHGERLKEQFFPLVHGSEFDAGFDVDRRPPGNVPIALITALLLALRTLQLQEKK